MKKRILAFALCMVLFAAPVVSSVVSAGDAGISTYKYVFEDGYECD
ncbi:MAG: hypothetical protein PUB28_05250 [Roseburia sp.]|nr:hypothetical protein [Roseburia sp.]